MPCYKDGKITGDSSEQQCYLNGGYWNAIDTRLENTSKWDNSTGWEKAELASLLIPGAGLVGLGGRAALKGLQAAHKLYKGVDLGKKAKKVKSLTDPLYRSKQLTKTGEPAKIYGKQVYGGVSPMKVGAGVSTAAYPFIASKNESEKKQSAGPSFLTPEQQRAQTFDQKAPAKPKTLAEQMKTKDYWNKSMSGIPGDTRLSRIAQLMSYYGQRKGQRTGTNPLETFAGLSSDAAKAVAAGQSTFDTGVGEQSFKSVVAQITPLVERKLDSGFTGYFGDPSAEDVSADAARLAKRALEFSEKNMIEFSIALDAVLVGEGYK